MSPAEDSTVMAGCERQYRALADCQRRFGRDVTCRHLNRALALCLVSNCCPAESDAVRSLCASAGTVLKRQQCQRARLDLSLCLCSHQTPS